MLRNRVNTVPSVRKIELSRENFCSGEPKLINFSTCRSSLEGCGRINQHFPRGRLREGAESYAKALASDILR